MIQNVLTVYLTVINLIAFGMYGVDKQKAIRKQWRIPEAQLLAVAALGGSVGAILGMQFFHHKTRKWKFRVGVPLILAVQLILWRMVQEAGRCLWKTFDDEKREMIIWKNR